MFLFKLIVFFCYKISIILFNYILLCDRSNDFSLKDTVWQMDFDRPDTDFFFWSMIFESTYLKFKDLSSKEVAVIILLFCLFLSNNSIFKLLSKSKLDLDKFSIIDMFDPDNPEIGAERVSRFTESMAQIADGTFFHRPTGAQGHQPAHATSHQNHKPIFDRCALQPRLGHCMHIWG